MNPEVIDTSTALQRTRPTKRKRTVQLLTNPLQVVRELNNRSLFHFVQYFWSTVSNDKFISNWHISYLCNELERIAERVSLNKPRKYDLLVNIPPGTTKTTLMMIMFPVWCWTKWYWMRFITASYSAALSLESAEYSRDLVRSEVFKAVYPELGIKEDKDTKSNFKVIKKKVVRSGRVPSYKFGGNRYSTSVGGTLTGFHGHILLVDDPLNPQQAVSYKELETANRWIDQTLSTRKVDKAVTPTILIMQRLHQDDPTGHILAKRKENVELISIPGEIRNFREQVEPKELVQYYTDDLLDPIRMSWDILKDMKADLGQYGYAGQVGQDPTPPGGGMFKVEHIKVEVTPPAPVNDLQRVRYWDKAGTEGGGAYTVGVKMLRRKSGYGYEFLVEDVCRGQWSAEEREKIIRETAESDGQQVKVYIEQEPGSGGKESAEATIRSLVGFSCYVDHPTGDKVYRADPFSVQVNSGNVHLLQADWNREYIEELRYFPFGTYKDQVDASSGAFNKLVTKKMTRVF